jgi:8-oxo-dGTP pyrophosphatase MutT (NUDIX family)
MKKATDITTRHLCPGCKWTFNNKKLSNNRPVVSYAKRQGPRIRAGVCMYCPKEDKLLIVQTYNEFIGLPKGGNEAGETIQQTALRELYEESGVRLESVDESKRVVMHRSCTYYIVEVESTDSIYPVEIHEFPDNDVSGAGWVHLNCIYKLPGRTTSHLDSIIRMLKERKQCVT